MPSQLFAEKPQKDIHSFIGTFTRVSDDGDGGDDDDDDSAKRWTRTIIL